MGHLYLYSVAANLAIAVIANAGDAYLKLRRQGTELLACPGSVSNLHNLLVHENNDTPGVDGTQVNSDYGT